MIEALSKVAEVGQKTLDSVKSSFDPDAKISKREVASSSETKRTDKPYNPDDKVEKAKNSEQTGETEEKDSSNTEKISYEIHTRNESLEGDKHPITGVSFERKTVEDADGNEVTGVFPVFDSEYDAQLPENLYKASDKEQFKECNKQLKEAVEKDPELAKKFTPEQLEQIKNGDTPDGYTWHHNEERGKMQLVDSDIHAKTGHTGGKTIWGGGNENR